MSLNMSICVMGHRLRQNDTNISEIYTGRPIYTSDVQYIYPTSDIHTRLWLEQGLGQGLGLGLGQGYRMSDIDIGYWMSDI